jgi:hypothetical protein
LYQVKKENDKGSHFFNDHETFDMQDMIRTELLFKSTVVLQVAWSLNFGGPPLKWGNFLGIGDGVSTRQADYDD